MIRLGTNRWRWKPARTTICSNVPRPEDLRTATVDVLGGGAPMTSEIARRVVESFRRAAKQPKPGVRLTTREEEVLKNLGA